MSIGKVNFAIKNFYKISLIIFVLLNYSCATQNSVSAQQRYIDNQVFYDQLSPYGEWVDYPSYGYVWIPDVDPYFSPYSTSGYWVMTDFGWTWVSDYPWGWATFHYGRWDYNNYYGWFWVPDSEWGPSWVTWRTGNGYYGWTPMRPGISISLSFGYDYRDSNRWNFVRERDFGRSDIHRYYVDRNDYNRIILNSRVINNTYIDQSRNTTYIYGPSRDDVQRVTGRKINNITIRDSDRPRQVLKDNQLQIYRPRIQNNNDRDQRPTPIKITNLKDIKPTRERISPDQRDNFSPNENNRREQQSHPQRQVERSNQSPRQQQIEKRNQEQQKRYQPQQSERQNQQQKQQVEKQQEKPQRQVQQQQERRVQEQQVKQPNVQQRQVQQQKPKEQKQTRRSREEQKQQSTDHSERKRSR